MSSQSCAGTQAVGTQRAVNKDDLGVGGRAEEIREASSEKGAAAAQRAEFLAMLETGLSARLDPIYDMQTNAVYGYAAGFSGAEAFGHDSTAALADRAAALGALEAFERIRVEKALSALSEKCLATRPHLFVGLDTRLLLADPSAARRLDAAFAAVTRPGRLILELEERHAPERRAELSRIMTEIRAGGARLALTGFGVGVGDLQALHAYPLDVIAIDPHFIEGVARDDRKQLLAGQMVALARHLGLKVIALGVSDEADLETCRALGFDLARGPHLIARGAAPRRFETPRPAAAPDRRIDASAMRLELDRIEPAHRDTALIEIAERFRHPDHPPLCPIIGDCGEPLGAIRERDLRPYAFSPFGLDLIRNPTRPISLERLLRPYPQADVESDSDRLMALLSDSGADGLMITSGVRYVGYLPAERLVRLTTAKRLAEAQDANPLTGLPGNRMVAAFMEQAIAETERQRILCYLDFDHFKPFNDVYGFRTGDRAIMLFADILKQSFGDSLICHIGGDDFFVGDAQSPEQPFFQTLENTLSRFRLEAESFYSPEDRAMGGLIAKGRDGAPRRFPLLRCSAGVVLAPEGHAVCSVERMAADIARIKRQAKEAPESIARVRLHGELGVSPTPGAAPTREAALSA